MFMKLDERHSYQACILSDSLTADPVRMVHHFQQVRDRPRPCCLNCFMGHILSGLFSSVYSNAVRSVVVRVPDQLNDVAKVSPIGLMRHGACGIQGLSVVECRISQLKRKVGHEEHRVQPIPHSLPLSIKVCKGVCPSGFRSTISTFALSRLA